MRRENYEILMSKSLIGLLSDCVYFCWQNSEISNDEKIILDYLLSDLYKNERSNNG